MGNLNMSQLNAIRDFLKQQGVTFAPLQEEMIDHISCDIERHMDEGDSYEIAWQKVLQAIPQQQLQTIQIQTMETINKNLSLSKMFAYLSFFLLFTGTTFKLLHYPGAGELLIASLAAITIAMISGSVSGIYLHRERKGVWLLLTILVGVILFLTSLTFQILHLPGATELRTTSVFLLGVFFPVSFFYLRNGTAQILPYLHEKYAPAITRFIFIFFCAASIIRIALLLTGYNDVVSRILLVIVIGAAGLNFFALQWHSNKSESQASAWLPTGLSISFLCFMLPALVGVLNPPLRTALIAGFFILAGLQAASQRHEGWLKFVAMISVTLAITAQLAWAFSSQGLLQFGAFHTAIIIVLVAALILQRKNPIMTMYLTAAIAHYLFVYPWELRY